MVGLRLQVYTRNKCQVKSVFLTSFVLISIIMFRFGIYKLSSISFTEIDSGEIFVVKWFDIVKNPGALVFTLIAIGHDICFKECIYLHCCFDNKGDMALCHWSLIWYFNHVNNIVDVYPCRGTVARGQFFVIFPALGLLVFLTLLSYLYLNVGGTGFFISNFNCNSLPGISLHQHFVTVYG